MNITSLTSGSGLSLQNTPISGVRIKSPSQIALSNVNKPDVVSASAPVTENKYEAAVQQIAQSYKGSYAVSDREFTIFKDATGKLITRYVSLRDGSITYEPSAPAVVKQTSGTVSFIA